MSRFCKTRGERGGYTLDMHELYTRYSLDVAASPQALWAVLTEPKFTRQYLFGCEAITDWKVGSALLWRGQHEGKSMDFVTGHVVAFEPGQVLAYTTFDPHGGLADVPGNYVTVRCVLTALPAGGTRLDWSQGDFAKVQNGEARFADASKGGDGVLTQLKALAEAL